MKTNFFLMRTLPNRYTRSKLNLKNQNFKPVFLINETKNFDGVCESQLN